MDEGEREREREREREVSAYSRRVSFNEKLYLAEERLHPGFCIQLVLEGEGSIERDALERAVASAAAANPGVRLVLRGVVGWSRWVATPALPPVRIVKGWAPGAPPPREIERPLPFDHGPTCEVVLANSEDASNVTRVVFRCFHGVMDGRGLLHFAEEVFRALRGEPLVGALCTQNDTEIVTAMTGGVRRPFLKSDCSAIAMSNEAASNGAHAGAADTPKVIWQTIVLAGVIHGLVAKIAAFLAIHSPAPRARIMIPVDVRNYKRDLQSTANMSYPLFVDVSRGQSWGDIQRSILKRLGAKEPMRLDPFETLLPWLPLWLFTIVYALWIGAQRRTRKYPFSALVTHVAIQGGISLNGGGFTMKAPYFLPTQADFIPLTVSAVTTKDAAKVVVSAPRNLVSEGDLARLCESLRKSVSESNKS